MSNNNTEKQAKIVGATSSVGTVAAGAVAATGMSASATTTTLAAIGSVVGGGMVAGVAVCASIPLAIGVGTYFGYKKLKGN